MTDTISYAFCPKYVPTPDIARGTFRSTLPMFDPKCPSNEPPIINVTSYDDTTLAITDGRLNRIIDEHTRYMRETDREIWAL